MEQKLDISQTIGMINAFKVSTSTCNLCSKVDGFIEHDMSCIIRKIVDFLRSIYGVEMPELKTSDVWLKERNDKDGDQIIIYDPDGWDRMNYDYSFYQEKISAVEFENRLVGSTISWKQNKEL